MLSTFATPRIVTEPRPGGGLLIRSTEPLAEHPVSVVHSFRAGSEAHPDRLLVAERVGEEWARLTWGEARALQRARRLFAEVARVKRGEPPGLREAAVIRDLRHGAFSSGVEQRLAGSRKAHVAHPTDRRRSKIVAAMRFECALLDACHGCQVAQPHRLVRVDLQPPANAHEIARQPRGVARRAAGRSFAIRIAPAGHGG